MGTPALVIRVCAIAMAGCSGESMPMNMTSDAANNSTLTVTVSSPNGGESYYPASMVQVQWVATGTGTLSSDVVATDGTTTIPVASNVATTAGATTSATWSVGTTPVGDTYRIEVTVTDDQNATASDTSDATFAIRAAQQVSLASQVQPIFNASCTGTQCHDQSQPQANLELTAAAAYTDLVGVNSTQCTTVKRVVAGNPDQSYLVWKLQGSGSGCFVGTEMPKGAKLSSAQINLVRDWIQNGAQNN